MSDARSFDPVWEEKYAAGHGSRYPWDAVVSFVFRHAPRDRPRGEVRVLELGCGTGANLWFAAREGFRACGVDASASALAAARARFEAEGLSVELKQADFTSLPFADASFDLVVDRAALTCCGTAAMQRALGEAARVAVPGGRLLFTPYAASHSSRASGRPGPDGVTVDIAEGTLVGVGQIRFVERDELATLLGPGWRMIVAERVELVDELAADGHVHAEWRVVAERV